MVMDIRESASSDVSPDGENQSKRQSNLIITPRSRSSETQMPSEPQFHLTKNWAQLFTVFPVDILLSLASNDEVIYNTGLFLLFGYDLHKCKEVKEELIAAQIKDVQQNQIFDRWFVELIQQMIQVRYKNGSLTLQDIEKVIITNSPQLQQEVTQQLPQLNAQAQDLKP